MVLTWLLSVAILLVGALADVASPTLAPGLRGARKNVSNVGSDLKSKVQNDPDQCYTELTDPKCGGTTDPSIEMVCSPVSYRPLTFNSQKLGSPVTDCGNEGSYLGIMANGQDFEGGTDPTWKNVRAWAGDFSGKGNLDYFVFHGCDGAGIQSDCLGDIKYIERIEYRYNSDSDSDWPHEDGKPDIVDGQVVLDGNVQKFIDTFPDGICGNFDSGKDTRNYCKFVHPGTELVHSGYHGGWWGGDNGADTAFGSEGMGFIDTTGSWTWNDQDKTWENGDDFGSAATGPWQGPLKQNVQNILNSYGGWHPFTEGQTFSFMLFDWRCEDSDANTNLFSYPSIASNYHMCFVDNEPGDLGYPPHVEIYFGTLTKDSENKDCIKFLRWDSKEDGSVYMAESRDPSSPYVIYPVHANDGSNVPY